MNNSSTHYFKIFLQTWAVLCILVMSINCSAFIFKFLQFNPGGPLHWLIWDDVYGHVGPMIFIIYIVWSVYLFKAANHPIEDRTFLSFTLWANVAHAVVMIPMALNDAMYHSKFLTDIPFLLVLSVGIYIWQPPLTRAAK
ncbi:MAG TPA: DUF6632 domain-containing protein [Cyclobacteriaceae bacterium]